MSFMHVDLSTYEKSGQLVVLSTKLAVEGMMESKDSNGVDIVFPSVDTFVDRKTCYCTSPQLKVGHTIYLDFMNALLFRFG